MKTNTQGIEFKNDAKFNHINSRNVSLRPLQDESGRTPRKVGVARTGCRNWNANESRANGY